VESLARDRPNGELMVRELEAGVANRAQCVRRFTVTESRTEPMDGLQPPRLETPWVVDQAARGNCTCTV
jgi:hypothetical protein